MILEKLTNRLIKHPEQGYALYFYHNGKSFEKVNGKEKEKDSLDISIKSNFRLASVTKQFIAFGIVRLIKEHKLSYTTTIKSLYPSFPNYFNNITIKHLLNHTSGIYDYENMPHKESDPQLQDEDIITFLEKTDKPYFDAGFTYRYSNTAYILLGLIIEKVSGIKLGDYYDQIFIEAEMFNSKVNYEGITNIDNRAYGHLLDKDNNLYVKDQYWCSATIGDGGIYSSINDLKKWCLYLSRSDEFNDMKIPNYINEKSYNEYGLGIRIIKFNDKEIYYHTGSTIGTNTLLLWSKELDLCLIFLTNTGGNDTTIMKDNLLLEILEKEK